MFRHFFQVVSSWPVVLQGVLGSAVFWAGLGALKLVGKLALRTVDGTTSVISRKRKFQEYIYRRYTSRNGLFNNVVGTYTMMTRAFQGLLVGLIFLCVAFFLAGMYPFPAFYAVCLVGAIIYFGSGLMWLAPSPSWTHEDNYAHWVRVAQLEKELFGSVEEETEKMVTQFAPSQIGATLPPSD